MGSLLPQAWSEVELKVKADNLTEFDVHEILLECKDHVLMHLTESMGVNNCDHYIRIV